MVLSGQGVKGLRKFSWLLEELRVANQWTDRPWYQSRLSASAQNGGTASNVIKRRLKAKRILRPNADLPDLGARGPPAIKATVKRWIGLKTFIQPFKHRSEGENTMSLN
jgi:hypothetical protein